MFTGHGVEYKVLDKDIILTQKEKPETYNQAISQQQNMVSGMVSDQMGDPLPGVSVTVKATAISGVRAAAGVILVTTNSGRKNKKLRVTLDAYYSIKKASLIKKPTSLYQHAEMALEITDGSFPVEYNMDELSLIAEGSD